MVNDMGVTDGKYDYEPFGKKMVVLDNQNRLTFIGKENDFESNFGDFGVRKYDDETGRFTSVDPLWERYHRHTPYNYCENNPVIDIDPTGLGPWDDLKDLARGIAAGVVQDFTTYKVPNTGRRSSWYNAGKFAAHGADAVVGVMIFTSGAATAAAGVVTAETGVGVGVATAGVAVAATGLAVATNSAANGISLLSENNLPQSSSQDQNMVGAQGTKTDGSKTLWTNSQDKTQMLHVENLDPGKRPANIHLHIDGKKFTYNFNKGTFEGLSKSGKKLLEKKDFKKAFAQALKIVGVKK